MRTARVRTSGEYLFDLLFFSIAPNYPIFGASGKPGAVQSEAQTLVKIPRPTVKKSLSDLVKDGYLNPQGKGRSSHYVKS